jgi:hypothetical protein
VPLQLGGKIIPKVWTSPHQSVTWPKAAKLKHVGYRQVGDADVQQGGMTAVFSDHRGSNSSSLSFVMDLKDLSAPTLTDVYPKDTRPQNRETPIIRHEQSPLDRFRIAGTISNVG